MKRALPSLLLLAALAGCGGSSATTAVVSTAAPSSAPATTLPPTTEAPTTSTTLSLAGRTGALGVALRLILCQDTSVRIGDCDVAAANAGVVEVKLKGTAVSLDRMRRAGQETGAWAAVDVARMGTTRALDGTIRSADGRATWTYHPDSGLTIVLEVK